MTVKLLSAVTAAFLLSAACGSFAEGGKSAAAENNANPVSAQTAPIAANTADISDIGLRELPWQTYTNRGDVRLLPDGLGPDHRLVKEVPLIAGTGSGKTKVILYERSDDSFYVHAALELDGITYDLGAVAGLSDEPVQIQDLFLFGKETIQIKGAVGAAASMTRYIDISDGVPKPLLLVDEGHASEYDIDHDGQEEVIASSGTIPGLSVYRLKDGHIERCQLNEALRADAVILTREGAIAAYFGQERVKLYWLKAEGILSFATYSAEEFESDRFVTIPYTPGDVKQIREQADRLRLFDPYVPRQGIATDYSVEAAAAMNREGTLKLTYPHFAIYESRADLRLHEEDQSVTGEKRYFPGFTAEWIGPAEGGGEWYVQRGSTYMSIITAKPFDKEQLLYVLASMIPLEEVKTSDGMTAALPSPPVTRDYLFALQAANEFAAAWAHRDPDSGLKWVTDEWKAGQDPLALDAYFRGTSSPQHMTFELSGKRRVDDRTYLFELRLYEYYTGQPDYVLGFPADYGRGLIIEVVKQGETEWGEGIWRVNP
ncbi:hypothetical protein [Paenibacillus ginsengarvi]|uniref:VCBS repeat-containing protein n=1 Tax=Paenibacillus ginsengarvi TaxID=400777 RepID=A0A3B0BV11_9BACL|nr:hypothetical protein [Paenibacillus ginsengarvi]RKN75847.1 hypothetical protein D7M11_25415 [Paenibacillus ginsengarvi]